MVLEDKIIVDFSMPVNKVYTMVQQYDKNSRRIIMQLKNNNTALDITGEKVSFIYRKEDNTTSFVDCTIVDPINDIVSILMDENMCITNGISKAQVMLYKDDIVLHSTMIKIRVASSLDEKEITSSNDFSVFNELLELKAYFDTESMFLIKVSELEPIGEMNINWIQPIE